MAKIIRIFFLISLFFFTNLNSNNQSEVEASRGQIIHGKASWYSSKEACRVNVRPHECRTAYGHRLRNLERDKHQFAASWNFRNGDIVKVKNKTNGKWVMVRIVDKGPNDRLNRDIDLGKYAFSKIADTKTGIIEVQIEKIKGENRA